jgi:hypothetical protein
MGGEVALEYPPQVAEVLEASGENRAELEQTLLHYTASGDSLKLQAAYFLIGNMTDHCYVSYVVKDTSGHEIDLNVLDYPGFDALIAYLDSVEAERGELDFKRDEKIEDIHTVTAEFLIDHIDHAFKAWREKPWARALTFQQFCHYVLPYRGSSEPLEQWRGYFLQKYEGIADKLDDPSDPIQAAALINDDIMSWFKFDSRYYLHPTDQGLSEMLGTKMGRCEDMTNLTIFAMRANGLAVTSDYTPYWANIGNNHAWNAIVTPAGKVIPFMGAEANPGKYGLAYKLAKAYRKTYAEQKNNLIFQERKQEKVPRWLAGKNYLDVTAAYTEVSDVVIAFAKEIPDSADLAYLCVFNSGEWSAIDWGRVKSNKALFTDMGTDVAYLPALYLNEEIVPYSPPFILNGGGDVQMLLPHPDEFISVALASTTRRTQDKSTEGMAVTYLTASKEYELSYWQDGWQTLGKKTAGEEPLVFDNVPAGCLYWLVEDGSKGEEERIFTIEDGKQVWW